MELEIIVTIMPVVILGIVQALKEAKLPKEYTQITAIGLGVVGGVLFSLTTGGVGVTLLMGAGYGLIAGLSATGLYEGYKTTKKTLTK